MTDFVQITRSYEAKSKWSDIAKQIDAGNNGYLNVGDFIRCTLKNGTEVTFDVLALNPYQPNSIALGFSDIHWEMPWNEENTNVGGWSACKMRKDFATEILPLLPDDLVEVITPRRIIQRIGGQEYESLDKLWSPSYTELFGADRGTDCTGDVGDIQFEFFKNRKNRIEFFKYESYYYATRSPYANYSTGFWVVNNYGNMNVNGNVCIAYGVCPCFIISQP